MSVLEVEPPVAGPDEVVIDVAVAGIGGSEYLGYNNPGIRTLPNIMGHGFAGTTAEGRRVAVNPLRSCGTCEYCRRELRQLCNDWHLIGVQSDGGFAQQVAVPEETLVTLPDDLGWEQAAFVEPFANAVNAWELSGADGGCSVAILGAGGLGLGLVACAAGAGCAQIAVSDLSQTRLDAAAELGAATCGNDTETHPEGSYDSYDVVFDTVGSVDSRRRAIDLTRKAGTCVLMGFAAPDLEANAGAFIRSQRRLLGAFVYSMTQFQTAVSLAARCKADWVANLSFAEVEPLLQRYLEGDFSTVKAALRPNG
ncbi:zinc-binding dehydrogenase [Pelagibius sp.]|uniref:zinc-binding dehydrogenase n=1 Tax=Pelagibius sp. TaxID=1931238 RepID=UPI003B510C87